MILSWSERFNITLFILIIFQLNFQKRQLTPSSVEYTYRWLELMYGRLPFEENYYVIFSEMLL